MTSDQNQHTARPAQDQLTVLIFAGPRPGDHPATASLNPNPEREIS